MKKFIYILALISAFFVPNIYAADLDYSDKKPPDTETQEYSRCNFYGDFQDSLLLPIAGDLNQIIYYCMSYIVERFEQKNEGGCYSEPSKKVEYTTGSFSQTIWRINTASDGTTACANDGTFSVNMQAFNAPSTVEEKCPNPDFPEYVHEYHELDQLYCLKEKEPEPPCPEPTGNEIPVFGVSKSKTTVCYDNQDGTQCQIETDDTGGYFLPLKYGNSEPVSCKEPEPDPLEPTEPEPTPEPDKPSEKPDPTDPENPDPRDPDVDSDSSSSATELDALNKANINLDAINKNLNKNSESNDERLATLILSVKNTNDLASSIKENTAATTNNTGKSLEEIGKVVDQLYDLNQFTSESNDSLDSIASDVSDISSGVDSIVDGVDSLNGGMGQLIEGIDGVNAALRGGDDTCEGEDCAPCEGDDCSLDDEILAELKKMNTAQKGSDFNKDNAQSFWESEYEEGLAGIWSEKKSEFESTEAFQFIEQFKFNAGGTAPKIQFCFNLGSHMDFGCHELPLPDASLLAIIKIFILITAAFLCRALVFGG